MTSSGYDLGSYEDDEQSGQSPGPYELKLLAQKAANDAQRAKYYASLPVPIGLDRVNAPYAQTQMNPGSASIQ